MSKPHCVYRFYDQDGLLLYVGLSCRLGERIARHRATQPWWSEVADIKVEHCPSRETAEQLESRLIAESMPRHNIKGRVEWPEPECECCGNQDLIGVEWGGMFYEHLRDVTPEGKVIADESNRHFRQEGAGIELWCENCGDVVPYPRGPLT